MKRIKMLSVATKIDRKDDTSASYSTGKKR